MYKVSQASWYLEEGAYEGEATWNNTLNDPLELLLQPESRDLGDQLPLDQLEGESQPYNRTTWLKFLECILNNIHDMGSKPLLEYETNIDTSPNNDRCYR